MVGCLAASNTRVLRFLLPLAAPEIARGTFGKLGVLWRIAAANLWLEPRYRLYLWLWIDRGSVPYFWLDLGGLFFLGFGHRFPCLNVAHRQKHGRFLLAVGISRAKPARWREFEKASVAFPVFLGFFPVIRPYLPVMAKIVPCYSSLAKSSRNVGQYWTSSLYSRVFHDHNSQFPCRFPC